MSGKAGMANFITGFRFLCSIALLFCPAFSPLFYVWYLIAGFTDMIDGAVARRTNTVSDFGAKLDTAADFAFVTVCLIKLPPKLSIPSWLWMGMVLIALIKMINIVSGYVMQKRFVALHTMMNKVTGALLFVLPLTLRALDLKYSGAVVCAVAAFAAIQEGHYIRTGKMLKTMEAWES